MRLGRGRTTTTSCAWYTSGRNGVRDADDHHYHHNNEEHQTSRGGDDADDEIEGGGEPRGGNNSSRNSSEMPSSPPPPRFSPFSPRPYRIVIPPPLSSSTSSTSSTSPPRPPHPFSTPPYAAPSSFSPEVHEEFASARSPAPHTSFFLPPDVSEEHKREVQNSFVQWEQENLLEQVWEGSHPHLRKQEQLVKECGGSAEAAAEELVHPTKMSFREELAQRPLDKGILEEIYMNLHGKRIERKLKKGLSWEHWIARGEGTAPVFTTSGKGRQAFGMGNQVDWWGSARDASQFPMPTAPRQRWKEQDSEKKKKRRKNSKKKQEEEKKKMTKKMGEEEIVEGGLQGGHGETNPAKRDERDNDGYHLQQRQKEQEKDYNHVYKEDSHQEKDLKIRETEKDLPDGTLQQSASTAATTAVGSATTTGNWNKSQNILEITSSIAAVAPATTIPATGLMTNQMNRKKWNQNHTEMRTETRKEKEEEAPEPPRVITSVEIEKEETQKNVFSSFHFAKEHETTMKMKDADKTKNEHTAHYQDNDLPPRSSVSSSPYVSPLPPPRKTSSYASSPLLRLPPEFAFIGRTSSGKSSLINAILNAAVAPYGHLQGTTTAVNFYRVGAGAGRGSGGLTLVDCPGYGYYNPLQTPAVEAGNAVRVMVEYLCHGSTAGYWKRVNKKGGGGVGENNNHHHDHYYSGGRDDLWREKDERVGNGVNPSHPRLSTSTSSLESSRESGSPSKRSDSIKKKKRKKREQSLPRSSSSLSSSPFFFHGLDGINFPSRYSSNDNHHHHHHRSRSTSGGGGSGRRGVMPTPTSFSSFSTSLLHDDDHHHQHSASYSLSSIRPLKRVFLCASSRGLQHLDWEYCQVLESLEIPFSVILTKTDAAPIRLLARLTDYTRCRLVQYRYCKELMLTSALRLSGIDKVQHLMGSMLGPPSSSQLPPHNTLSSTQDGGSRGFEDEDEDEDFTSLV